LLRRTTGDMTWIRRSAKRPATLAQQFKIVVRLRIAENPQIQTATLMTTNVFSRAIRIQFHLSVSCPLTAFAAIPGQYY
jgi:hypothetical protein